LTPSRRILIITPDIAGPIRNGGIGTAFGSLGINLQSKGYSVSILYTLGTHCEQEEPIEYWVDFYRSLNICLISMNEPTFFEFPEIDAPGIRSHSYRIYLWLKLHQLEYDLVIYPEWGGEAYYALQARKCGLDFTALKFIVNIHSPESWARSGNYQLPHSIDDIERDYMEREVVAAADAVVSPSNYLFEWMALYGWILPAQKMVIQNLLDTETINDQYTPSVKRSPTEIVFFGRLEHRKGLGLFCAAIDQLNPEVAKQITQVTFVGKSVKHGKFESEAYLRTRCKTWSVPIKVITTKNKNEAVEYLDDIQRLPVIPSLVENSPYTVLECLDRGIPFIASAVGGIPELLPDNIHQSYLFQPAPVALACLLGEVIINGITPAHRIYRNTDLIDRWSNLIDDLLNVNYPEAAACTNQSNNALVSICLVHYDRPLLLSHALASIRSQTYQNIEVVLVDDGSPSAESIRYLNLLESEFEARKWKIIRQANRYLGSARNAGARAASGEFLFFMDDDNIAIDDEISIFMHAQEQSNADVLTCLAMPFSNSKTPQKSGKIWLPLGASSGVGVLRNGFGDANALWKKEVFFKLNGYTEDYGVGHEDWELFADAVLSGYQLQLIPKPLFWYRVNENGMLRSGNQLRDHSRNIRPYIRHNPAGLGMLLAYALSMQLERNNHIAIKNTALLMVPFHNARFLFTSLLSREMRIRLRTAVTQHGLRGAFSKIVNYLVHK
jgi:glycosyltransferase involved in cell wall biosynthesis